MLTAKILNYTQRHYTLGYNLAIFIFLSDGVDIGFFASNDFVNNSLVASIKSLESPDLGTANHTLMEELGLCTSLKKVVT